MRNLQKGIVKCMMGMLGRNLYRGWLFSRPSFRGGVGGVKYCCKQCRSNFGLPNYLVIHSTVALRGLTIHLIFDTVSSELQITFFNKQ